jgi:hypothetical protein
VPQPSRILAIGLGDAVMCNTAVLDSGVSELVIVELNSALADVLAHTSRGQKVLHSPKVRLINDDGRRWLAANPGERFDMIMMFPLHPGHAYYGNLFSKEFFDLAASHLTPTGLLAARTVDLFSTARTLINAFEHVVRVDGSAYLASRAPLQFDAARLPVPASRFTKLIEADSETILANTKNAPLSWDLRPNSEYYLSYRYAGPLSPTSYTRDRVYFERDPARFASLLMGAEDAIEASSNPEQNTPPTAAPQRARRTPN